MTAFGTYVHTIVDQSGREAHCDGSATIEAQHLLLAIAAREGSATHNVLASAGLDHGAVREALDAEFDHSLRAAGVSREDFGVPSASREPRRPARLGASAKLALERGMRSSGVRKDRQPAHLLLGILQAEVGTVPRALALAGVDRAALMVHVLQTLPKASS